jgi:chemotaxis signal transduction protein
MSALDAEQQRIETIWRERAKRLSRPPASAGDGKDALQVIVLGIGQERFGVDFRHVAEVLPPVVPTPVPGAAAGFAGVINVHGEIRPVIDLRRVLGLEKVAGGDLARVILLRKDGLEVGLRIDSVEQIRSIRSGELRPDAVSDAGPSPYIEGSTEDLLMLLSTEALFRELEIGVTT